MEPRSLSQAQNYTRTVSSASLAYQEKLKNPKWQRKRLEILEANHFRCEDCGRADKTLEIHHCHYIKGMEPWNYSMELLMCLCCDCHESRQSRELAIHVNVAKAMRCLKPDEMESVTWDIIGAAIAKINEKYAQSFTS